MKGKLGLFLMCLGTVLLAAALSLFLYNSAQSREAEKLTQELLPQLVEQIALEETRPSPSAGDGSEPTETRPVILPGTPMELLDPAAFEMTEVEIDGHKYIGYLAISELGLELPIMSDWSYPKLKIAPCRYSGTVLSEDLVIMAHNYRSQFGPLKNLSPGAEVSFTDMDGVTTWYSVAAVEILPPTAVEDMTAGDFDLTLFTCTIGGTNRVTVRCDRLEGNE